MLIRLSDNYVVDIDKVVSARIVSSTSKRSTYLSIIVGSETGETNIDNVSFATDDEAKSALDKLMEYSDNKDTRNNSE